MNFLLKILGNSAVFNEFFDRLINDYSFLFGVHNLNVATPHIIYRKADTIIKHDDIDAGNFLNDIALVKLNKLVHFNNYVRPICLPEKIPEAMFETSFQKCRVCGWGETEGE